jgi:hypothetical protein
MNGTDLLTAQAVNDDGRAALVNICQAYGRVLTAAPPERLAAPDVAATAGAHLHLYGLLLAAAHSDSDSFEDDLTAVVDAARNVHACDDLDRAHATCCDNTCGCTGPVRSGQPPREMCADCLDGLAYRLEVAVDRLIHTLSVTVGALPVLAALHPEAVAA